MGTSFNISNLKTKNEIREIYLFGSVARGDYDKYSDTDILIVIDNCLEEKYISLKKEYSKILNIPSEWISLYRLDKIQKMHNSGAYFLWHIKQEGICLFSRNNELEKLLLTLPKYKNTSKDLTEYKEILNDIKSELHNTNISVEYELAVLSSLVRNTCIAIAYLNDILDFGRTSAVLYCKQKYNLNFTMDSYNKLYQYRLYDTGKISSVPNADISILKEWIHIEENLLQIGESLL